MNFNNEFPDERDRGRVTIFDLVFTIIAFLAAGFSGYTTFKGFYFDFSFFPAFIIALIIGLGLLIINFKIRDAKRDGESLAPPLTAFFLFLIFSFISNTNAFYSFFLEKDGSKNTQIEAWRVFDKGTETLVDSLNKYTKTSDYQKNKKKLDQEYFNFEKQVKDLNNPGVGAEARRHLGAIEDILNVVLTDLKRPPKGSAPSAYTGYLNDMKNLIYEQFEANYSKSNIVKIKLLIKNIEKSKIEHQSHVQIKKSHESNEDKHFNSSETDKMDQELRSFKTKAQDLISFNKPIEMINRLSDDIGSFQYTWANFLNREYPMAIILSVLLSLMLDILTPFLSILLYKREVEL